MIYADQWWEKLSDKEKIAIKAQIINEKQRVAETLYESMDDIFTECWCLFKIIASKGWL